MLIKIIELEYKVQQKRPTRMAHLEVYEIAVILAVEVLMVFSDSPESVLRPNSYKCRPDSNH